MNREILRERILALIARAEADGDPGGLRSERDALIQDVAAHQGEVVRPYRKLVGGARQALFDDWPLALPTEVFRHVRVAAHPPEDDVRVFRTSGTTSGARGSHAFADLALYDRAAEVAARAMLFHDTPRARLIVLAPTERDAPDSSLSYMLARFAEWFGTETTWVWPLESDALVAALTESASRDEPTAVLGTSFAFVHAEDTLANPYALPPGSFVMQTGGFKGRSREVAPETLRAALAARYGVDEARVVGEYGMTELSSQLYETSSVAPSAPRRYRAPAWVRVVAVDPERLEPLPPGERGLLRIDDVANLDSVACLQTADSATVHEDETVELHGRHPGALPRGCSLAVEEALGG